MQGSRDEESGLLQEPLMPPIHEDAELLTRVRRMVQTSLPRSLCICQCLLSCC